MRAFDIAPEVRQEGTWRRGRSPSRAGGALRGLPGRRAAAGRSCLAALCALACWGGAAGAQAPELPLPPGAALTAEAARQAGRYALPNGAAEAGPPPAIAVEGQVGIRAWRIPDAPPPTRLVAPIRATLEAAGYEILLDCETERCGGFDFRYGTEVLPPPEMHVDLGAFRFLSARRTGAAGPEAVSALASRSGDTGHLQIVTVTPDDLPAPAPTATTAAPEPAPAPALRPAASAGDAAPAPGDLGARLAREGRAVLDGLAFAPGKATLDAAASEALAAVARWLGAESSRRLVLVGHTDMTGALEANIALSRRRAATVRERLIRDHGIARERVTAEGAGWLAPRSSNATAQGRAANRRVEAVVRGD